MPCRKITTTRSTREQPYQSPTSQRIQSTPGTQLTELRPRVDLQAVAHRLTGIPEGTGVTLWHENNPQIPLPSPQRGQAEPPQHARRSFRRRGTFPFLALPLEIRQMIYNLLLIPIGDRLITLHFGQFMQGLGGPSHDQNILRVCRSIRREAVALLYSGSVYIRGFDLVDFSSSVRLSQHAWLLDKVRPIKSLRVRLSLLATEADFDGRSEVFMETLPECRALRIELSGEQDLHNIKGKAFLDFVSSLRLEGLEVKLKGSDRLKFDENREKISVYARNVETFERYS